MDIETYSKQLTYSFITDERGFNKKLSSDVDFFEKVCRVKHVSFHFDKKEVEKAESDVKIHLIQKNLDLLSMLINNAVEVHKLENLRIETWKRKEKPLSEVLEKQDKKWHDYRSELLGDINFIEDTIEDILEQFELTVDFYLGRDSSISFRTPQKKEVTKEEYDNAKDWQKLFIDDKFFSLKLSIELLINEINRHLSIIFKYLEQSKNFENREQVVNVLSEKLDKMIHFSSELKENVPEIEHTRALYDYFIQRRQELLDDDFKTKGSIVNTNLNSDTEFQSFFKNVDNGIKRKIEIEFANTLSGYEIAAFVSVCLKKEILIIKSDSKSGKSLSKFIQCFTLNNSLSSVTNYLNKLEFTGNSDIKDRISEDVEKICSSTNAT